MKTETKHTPGPWTAESTTSSEFVTRAIRGPNDELIAHVGVPGYSKTPDVHQNVADAHLIASAPDLLEACKAVMNDPYTTCACAEKVRAAIQKATGAA